MAGSLGVELSVEQAAELRELVNSRDVPADIATRGRIVLWSSEGRRRKDIAELLGVSLPTVDRWKIRYAEQGLAGLEGERPGGAREQVPARVRARVIALTRMTPPDGTGLSHWSTRPGSAAQWVSDESNWASAQVSEFRLVAGAGIA
jgi:Homeodomain-like domain-containing protein